MTVWPAWIPVDADDIVKARRRVRAKTKAPTDGQIISKLGFGFWRFLVARRYQTERWPDLASGFRYAPNRARHLPTVYGAKVTTEASHWPEAEPFAVNDAGLEGSW